MILHALNSYYKRLAADPDSGVAEFGYSQQQISFLVVLEKDGTLHEIQDARQEDDKGKLRPISLVVPGNAKPSGSGIHPCFLWDNPIYSLGYKPEDKKPKRTQRAFKAFRGRHLAAEEEIDDEGFSAVCRFLEAWDPEQAADHEKLVETKTGFGVFKFRGANKYIHERPAIKAYWESQLEQQEANDKDEIGHCLVTGRMAPIARLHEPKIKGVWGGLSSGAVLVSFNCDSFESYGKSKKRGGLNAPVAEQTVFQYCVALNRLLEKDSGRRMSVGDTSVVFWTEKPSPAEGLVATLFNPSVRADDEMQLANVRPVLDAIYQGKRHDRLGDPKTAFYVLGLAPNAGRISVRFWHEGTVGGMVDKLHDHFAALEIIQGPKDLPYPPLWRLLGETARESKDIPNLLEGALFRSIITGEHYPQMFYNALIRRIRADGELRYMRAAAIKACLCRNYSKEISVSLNPDHPDQAYHLGRLFAELERVQEEAIEGINSTIKDRYFGAASATPGSVLPRIIRMSQHHLGKLNQGKKRYREGRIREILENANQFPSHLSLCDQGLFAIGYYHQRTDIFSKKNREELDTAETE